MHPAAVRLFSAGCSVQPFSSSIRLLLRTFFLPPVLLRELMHKVCLSLLCEWKVLCIQTLHPVFQLLQYLLPVFQVMPFLQETRWKFFLLSCLLLWNQRFYILIPRQIQYLRFNVTSNADLVEVNFFLYNYFCIFKIFSMSSIRASISLCSSFAASYSAFSERSPCSLASLIFAATSFLLTLLIPVIRLQAS